MKKIRYIVVIILMIFLLSSCDQKPVDQNNPLAVTYSQDGGAYQKPFLQTLPPEYTMTIKALDVEESNVITLYHNDQTKLRWVNKLFITYHSELDLYEVSDKDPMTASVSDLNYTGYDFIIGMHNQYNDAVYKAMFQALFETNEPIYIWFNQDPNSYQSGDLNAFFYTQSGLSNITKTVTQDTTLPTLIKPGYTFLGWFDGNTILSTLKVEQYQTSLTLEAKWRGKTVSELESYLSDIIPTETNDTIYLPLSFSGYQITWISSDESIISQSGLYQKPYERTAVTLTAHVTGLETLTLDFIVYAEGYKSLEGPIASSYIYRNYNQVNDRFFEILDIINTAFIIADDQANLNGSAYLNNVTTYIMPKAKIHGNYVVMSVAPESSWSTIAANASLRETFANNIVDMINQYGFDGVDIDWETPLDSEKTRFTALMKVVYEKVKANNPNHLVTTAITGGMWQPPRYDLTNSNQYLDYINLMTYGMTNSNGQYQNPLYRSTVNDYPTFLAGRTLGSASIDESVQFLKNTYGVHYNKIIVGLAFYGIRQVRTYDTVSNTYSSWGRSGSVYYNDIVLNYLSNDDYIKRYDTNAGVPYIVKADGTEFISYDNPRSILEKTAYVIEQGLGGVMFWEYGTDTTNTLLEAIDQGYSE